MSRPRRRPDQGQLEGHPTVDYVEAARLSRCSCRICHDSVLRPELDDLISQSVAEASTDSRQ